MEKLKTIEISSSISAILSKILLACDSIFGWPFAFIGYVLVAWFNLLKKKRLLATTVMGLSAMCLYGWYKWSHEVKGLTRIDYIILAVTFLFAVYIYWKTARKQGLMGHLEGIITVSTLSAFLMLGYRILLGGWIALFLSHILLAYFYGKLNAKYYVGLQILSAVIAVYKIYQLV